MKVEWVEQHGVKVSVKRGEEVFFLFIVMGDEAGRERGLRTLSWLFWCPQRLETPSKRK